ncbi:hypothetical protein NL533_33175, partial [Klebsiella pneumoniae]|nr:hypothetical protein [Klebsiella pneumoniae]
ISAPTTHRQRNPPGNRPPKCRNPRRRDRLRVVASLADADESSNQVALILIGLVLLISTCVRMLLLPLML